MSRVRVGNGAGAADARHPREAGFTLIEMIVVVFLLAIAMLGILAVFDASARINKSEQDVADAQGAVRYGIYQMTRAVRMAGAGGLFVEQAVLNDADPQLLGINAGTNGRGYDNVVGATVTDINTGLRIPVRDGTDMIEIRGVINSPLLSFDHSQACGGCTSTKVMIVPALTSVDAGTQKHYNDEPTNRPQFSAIDTYTAGVTPARPMFVILTANDEIHPGAASVTAFSRYPQSSYNVGRITAPTNLVGASSFGTVDFGNGTAQEYNSEIPSAAGIPAAEIDNMRRIGVLDDLIYFIDNTDPLHPALAQGTRRGVAFDVVRLADDVEDMQIAYGVDTDGNDSLNRLTATSATDTDANVSNVSGGDEWQPNVGGATPEPVYVATDFQSDQPPPATFTHGGATTAHFPRLHGVMISLVAKSKDPDPTYKSPNALGVVVMNTPVTVNPPYPDVAQYTGVAQYRRRVQTIKINLRNYAVPG